MEIPEGVGVNTEVMKNYLWKLEKSLYGLKISPKKWNDRFSRTMYQLGFVSHDFDSYLFVNRDNKLVFVLLYVDDILLASDDFNKLNSVRNLLNKEFTVKDLGDPKLFLGIKVERNRQEQMIQLRQEKFITNILKRFGFEKTRPVSTPIQTNQAANYSRRNREEDEYTEAFSSNTLYRGAIGSLL